MLTYLLTFLKKFYFGKLLCSNGFNSYFIEYHVYRCYRYCSVKYEYSRLTGPVLYFICIAIYIVVIISFDKVNTDKTGLYYREHIYVFINDKAKGTITCKERMMLMCCAVVMKEKRNCLLSERVSSLFVLKGLKFYLLTIRQVKMHG